VKFLRHRRPSARERRRHTPSATERPRIPSKSDRPRNRRTTLALRGDPVWEGLPPDYWTEAVEFWEWTIARLIPERDQGFSTILYGPWALLRTSHKLFLHSWYVADFGPLAVLVAYQAVEAALQTIYYDHRRDSFEKLIDRAAKDGRLEGDAVAWAHDAREMRNVLSHPFHQTWSGDLRATANMVDFGHRIVIDLLAPIQPEVPWPAG
jgi:hypothetical protein